MPRANAQACWRNTRVLCSNSNIRLTIIGETSLLSDLLKWQVLAPSQELYRFTRGEKGALSMAEQIVKCMQKMSGV